MDLSFIIGSVSFGPRIMTDLNNESVMEFGMLSAKNGRRVNDPSKSNKYTVYARGRMVNLAPYIAKGQKVLVIGMHTVQAYLDKDGQPQASGRIEAFNIEILDRKADTEAAGTGKAARETGFDVRNDVL